MFLILELIFDDTKFRLLMFAVRMLKRLSQEEAFDIYVLMFKDNSGIEYQLKILQNAI